MQLALPLEIDDLRKRPFIEAPAIQSPYVCKSPPPKETDGLPIGTQAQFVEAAESAASLGAPINTLLTIRWRSLFSDNDVNPLRAMGPAERIRNLVDLLRKWLRRNGAPPFYIWVRENADDAGEHFHMAFHLPKKKETLLKNYVVRLTGERPGRGRSSQATEGEFAWGEVRSWHLARDTQPDRNGVYLAAYLGKGEPSQRIIRGKLVDNDAKPFRGKNFGGSFANGKYDIVQGRIEGTATRKDRYFIANELKRAAAQQSKIVPTVERDVIATSCAETSEDSVELSVRSSSQDKLCNMQNQCVVNTEGARRHRDQGLS